MLKLRWMALCLVMGSVATAANEPGVIGWRGDGTGIHPGVTPPTKWQHVSEQVAALKFQSTPPAADAPAGTPMPDGVIREWLVAGPVADKDDPLNVEDQSSLAPKPGDKFGAAEWRAIKISNAYIDFKQGFKLETLEPGQAAYAFSYIYSPEPVNFLLNYNHTGTANVWINGKPAKKGGERDQSYSPPTISLTKGWNRIMIRCTSQVTEQRPQRSQFHINAYLRAMGGGTKFISPGLKWRTLLPAGTGCGSPITVGGKIFLQSEPNDLVCLDAATGKILWIRPNGYNELATDTEKQANPDVFKQIKELEATLKKENDSFVVGNPPTFESLDGSDAFKVKLTTERQIAKLMKDIDDTKYSPAKGQDVGNSGFTPVTDGKHVWAWFASGVTCCFDLDGKLIWRRVDNEGSFFEHGYSTSPLLVDGKLIIFMNKMIAFDAKTGNRLWTTELAGLPHSRALLRFHGTPAVAKVGGASIIALPTGHIIRVADGKMIRDKGPGIGLMQQEMPSPVVLGNTLYTLSTYSVFTKMMLPSQMADPLEPVAAQPLKVDVSNFPYYYLDWFMSSPLIVDDLAYCMNNSGVLNVVDTKTMTLLYQKLLDIDHFQNTAEGPGRGAGISPAYAGGNIYLVGNYGTTLVIKPGRTYEQISKNKIESLLGRRWGTRPERFIATPTFAGKNMFLRGERYLYCLGE